MASLKQNSTFSRPRFCPFDLAGPFPLPGSDGTGPPPDPALLPSLVEGAGLEHGLDNLGGSGPPPAPPRIPLLVEGRELLHQAAPSW